MLAHYPRPKILNSIPLDAHAVIEASAGTGKTFAIENVVVELLLRDQAMLDEILVLTFTERAAAELRSRIRSKLEEIRFQSCESANCGHDIPSNVWSIDEAVKRRLDQALTSFDSASVGTIHGFFGRVLKEHAFNSGQLFSGDLIDGRALFSRAYKTTLRRSLARTPGEPAELLSTWLEQKTDGIERLEDLLYRCLSARSRILPPFKADEIQREIDSNALFIADFAVETEPFLAALKQAGAKGPTLKAIATRLGTISGKIKSMGRHWRVLLDQDFRQAIEWVRDKLLTLRLTNDRASAIAQSILRLHGSLISLEAAIVQTSLREIRPILEANKASTGEHDYDDLISGVKRALDSQRGHELIHSMRSRYRYALIDEFQDTDELQWDFFRRVFLESDKRNLLYLVGDPKQAIYSFRGADVFTYLQARACSIASESPLVPLSENFRSASSLIDACNHFFDQTAVPPFFSGQHIQYDQPVTSGRELIVEIGDGLPNVPIHLLKIEPDEKDSGIGMVRRVLVRRIAHEVSQLMNPQSRLKFGLGARLEQLEARDVFILTAKNSEAIEIGHALRQLDVPFAFYKQDGLFQTGEARQIRDLLLAVNTPDDRLLRSRAWITPFFAVPLEDLPALVDVESPDPLVESLVEWKALANNRRFESLFNQILNRTGIIRRELFQKDDERSLTNYLHLFEFLLEETRATGCDLARLISTLTAYINGVSKPPGEDGNVQRLETDRDAVQIMTIHKSKGLEAAVVFVFGGFTSFSASDVYQYHDPTGERVLFVGDSADARQAAARERKEELERLYYVALTRAKARLYLPFIEQKDWAPNWNGGYRAVNDRLNRIVEELPGSASVSLFRVLSAGHVPSTTEVLASDASQFDLFAWKPPRELIEDQDQPSLYYPLRDRHAGFQVTSYSGLKSDSAAELVPLGRNELEREIERPAVSTSRPEDLPGGTATGLLLHEILEKVPFESIKAGQSPEEWAALEEVSRVVKEAIAHHSVKLDDHNRGQVMPMIHRALTMSVPTEAGKSIPGFYKCQNHLREMEFLFPYPEVMHPSLAEKRPRKLVIERGFIKGYIDLVVEHDGLVFLVDWKSDVLASYEPEPIQQHVADHYDLQLKLYTLALLKALRIGSETDYEARFGGMIYIFLRGLVPADDKRPSMYFHRPKWSQILSYEQDIKNVERRPRNALP